MPKKKTEDTPEKQSERFKAEVRRMVTDGELNPTDADKAMDMVMSAVKLRGASK